MTACDFIEYIPSIIYMPKCKFPLMNLMSEIFQELKSAGFFLGNTPAYPSPKVYKDTTHVNTISDKTFPYYFNNQHNLEKFMDLQANFNNKIILA